MYYSNGNFEAFARPRKPAGIEDKQAYLVGSGLAALAAATFLVRDAQMPGDHIHILEELALPGGSLDGLDMPNRGFVVRGGREMENHFECLWDMYRSIPSLTTPNASVLDEFYWLNKDDPNQSQTRIIWKQGTEVPDDFKMTLTDQANSEIIKLCLTPEDKLQDVKISDVFTEDFFNSNFWEYWKTMFAFEPWQSAMEMRRYLMRFIHHIDGIADLSALKFTRYNQYESLVLPAVQFLQDQGVDFQYSVTVDNIIVDEENGQKTAQTIQLHRNGEAETIALTPQDYVFVTNGSITESTTYGDQDHPAQPTKDLGGSWQLWENLAAQDPAFGRPKKFYNTIPEKSWFVSATATLLDDKIPQYIQKITHKDPYSGQLVTGGPVSVRDSSWQMSFVVSRQPHFAKQPKNEIVAWVYALYSDVPGDFVKKPITECTGAEITEEWLYHMGVPTDQIVALATQSAHTIPVYMPFITSYFMPRADGDRPKVVPAGSQNLAFIGNFADTGRDTVFTTEYSVRTAMEAVYTLMNVDRGVPEVFASVFDARELLKSVYYLEDGKKITDLKAPSLITRVIGKQALKKVKGTYIEELLRDAKLL
ncbi:oleate hydratase [Schleiferilactobacillus shenzhenensis]|uniref:Oleate hydratase n=1 Tax=Schleiferilactobacillus shenzhenensis LY-73 TaxID=1231336 RepID=U4TGJ6_9LACO|nr:oleate hydratase [Schleiferilactobacillus shenzhenensis]ERL63891.1 hypothetical protein L248_1832 [Schleiferilactobacillus shenzhenensis LY-73]